MKNKKILLSLISLVLLITSCSANNNKLEDDKSVEYKYVKIKKVVEKEFSNEIVLSGQSEAFELVQLTSKLNGEIESINKNIGDSVKIGEVLTNLDNETFLLNYNNAKNSYENSLIALNKIEDIEGNENLKYQPVLSAKNNFKSLEAKYNEVKKNYDNMLILYEEGAISENDYNTIESAYISTKENYEMATNSYLTAKNNYKYDIQQIRLNVKTAKNNMESAKKVLDDSVIKSPISGVVSFEDVSIGENISPGKLLFKVINLDKIYINSGVSEKDINNIKCGQSANIKIDSLDMIFKGEIVSVGPSPNDSTQKYPVKILLNNKENLIKEKMYAEVSVVLQKNKYYSIPKESVVTINDKKYIYVLKGDRAKKIEVKITAKDDNNYGIKNSLKGIDNIVVLGQNMLNDGDLIKVD